MKWHHLITALTLLALANIANAQELYRYRDANGTMRMEPTIPAEYVDKGYDVLNSRGMLIRRVPAREIVVNTGDDEQRAEDNILLSSYSSVDEIVAHQERRTAGVQRQIEIIMSDRRVIAGELDKEIRSASGYRANGREVPEEISSRIDELDGMIKSLDQQMVQRAEEKQAITDEFNAKVERFKELHAEE